MLYRKKPIIVDAFQWTGGSDQTEDPEWIIQALIDGTVYFIGAGTPDVALCIQTLDGLMVAIDKINELNDFEHSQLAKLLAENGRLKKALNRINDISVSWQETGGTSEDAFAMSNEVYKLSFMEQKKQSPETLPFG